MLAPFSKRWGPLKNTKGPGFHGMNSKNTSGHRPSLLCKAGARDPYPRGAITYIYVTRAVPDPG